MPIQITPFWSFDCIKDIKPHYPHIIHLNGDKNSRAVLHAQSSFILREMFIFIQHTQTEMLAGVWSTN